jgi:hypothetical protein
MGSVLGRNGWEALQQLPHQLIIRHKTPAAIKRLSGPGGGDMPPMKQGLKIGRYLPLHVRWGVQNRSICRLYCMQASRRAKSGLLGGMNGGGDLLIRQGQMSPNSRSRR